MRRLQRNRDVVKRRSLSNKKNRRFRGKGLTSPKSDAHIVRKTREDSHAAGWRMKSRYERSDKGLPGAQLTGSAADQSKS